MLSGGIQAVRVVLRALTLWQLHADKSVAEVAASVRLTPKAVREIGRRYEDSGLEQALYDKQRPGAAALLEDSQWRIVSASALSPWCAATHQRGALGGPCDWWPKKRSSDDWSHE